MFGVILYSKINFNFFHFQLSLIDFYFYRYKDPRDQIPAMHKVIDIADRMNFTTGDKISFVWTKYFATWITDEVILHFVHHYLVHYIYETWAI